MAETGSAAPIRELCFEYPDTRKFRRLSLFCHTVLIALVGLLYYPHVAERFGTGFLVGLLVCAVVFTMWTGFEPLLFWPGSRAIVLSADGIRAGRRFVRWDDVVRIDPGQLYLRDAVIRLKLKREKIGFLDIRGCFKRRLGLRLPAYPFVYRDVIPAIRQIRPDLAVSPKLARALQDPERSTAPRRWSLLPVLCVGVGLMAWSVVPGHGGLLSRFVVGNLLILMAVFAAICVPMIRGARDAFLRAALACPLFVGPVITFQFYTSAEHYALEAVVAAGVAMLLAAAVVVLATKRLSRIAQVSIAIVMLAAPTAAYLRGRARVWPVRDISHFIPQDEAPFWGRSDIWMAPWWSDDMDRILHLPTLPTRPIPVHEGSNVVLWLDERLLIRRTEGEGEATEAWAYDLQGAREWQLPVADTFKVSSQQPISPDGRLLAWLDFEGEDEEETTTLRVWDLINQRDAAPPRRLPEAGYRWGANWLDARRIVVAGQLFSGDSDEGFRVALMRVSLDTGEIERSVSARLYSEWHPTLDFQHAFARDGTDQVCFIDLETDEAVTLPVGGGGGLPYPVSSEDCAFRVVRRGRKATLMRFDFKTAAETPVCRVPRALDLHTVSRTARFAVLISDDEMFLAEPLILLVHIPSGRQRYIYPGGMLLSLVGGQSQAPMHSPISPDERMIVWQSYAFFGGQRTVLCYIPDDWPTADP